MLHEWAVALFSDYTFRIVAMGTAFIGLVSGTLGSFAVLRKQSLLGDAMSHAALPGIAMAFILTGQKSSWVLLTGALIAGWIGAVLMTVIVEKTTLKRDAALGIILSVFFGFGLVLLTYIQHLPTGNKSGLNTYLFGNAATLLKEDLFTMGILGSIALIIVILGWKEFKLISFDPVFSQSIGYPTVVLDLALTTLLVLAIVIGLQAVGVVLMSAMVIAPAAAARQWTDSLVVMVGLAGFFGAMSSVIGVMISSSFDHLPTGPVIVMVMSTVVVFSLFFAANRGLVWEWVRHYKNRQHIHENAMLTNLLLFSESMTDPYHPHDLSALQAVGKVSLQKTLDKLQDQNLIQTPDNNTWGFTVEGYKKALKLKAEEMSS